MAEPGVLVASYALNACWQVPLLAGAGWLICRMLRRLGPAAEHRVWVAVLAGSTMLPAVGAMRFGAGLRGEAARPAAAAAVRMMAASGPVKPEHWGVLRLSPVLIELICAVYLLVWLVAGLRFAVAVARSVRLVRQAEPLVLRDEYAATVREVSQRLGAPKIRVLVSAELPGPATLWLRGPVLLLPAGFVETTGADDFRAAVAHEIAHVVRHDYGKNLWLEGWSTLVAFHPVAWWIKAQLAVTREMSCDAVALASVGGRGVYLQSLLRLAGAVCAGAAPAPVTHAIGIFDANNLEKRMMTLRAKRKNVSVAARYGLVVAASVALLLALAGGSAAAVELLPRGVQVTAKAQEEVYSVGGEVSAPKVLIAPNPEFPDSARAKKGVFEGVCRVGLVVDAAGKPRDLSVMRSLGKDFDDSALKAVAAYRFAPAMRLGVPVAVRLQVELKFEKF